jgi:signal transduction histidine kinase
MRTPLNCSISLLEIMEKNLLNSKLKEEYLDPAIVSNKLLLNLINDILDFAQIEN